MTEPLQTISLLQMSIAILPMIPVVYILYRWRLGHANALYAISRMLVQLLIIGYFLAYIFESESALIVLLILGVMVFASSWIALGATADQRPGLYGIALVSIGIGGGATLLVITQGVLLLDPWFTPSYMIPLAGMIFANSMNAVSLAAERLGSEIRNGVDYLASRNRAFQASMIPVINSLFAVGLVSLPGMMTGQILSGVSPLVAVRYQIVVMCMIFGSAGISSALFLVLSAKKYRDDAG